MTATSESSGDRSGLWFAVLMIVVSVLIFLAIRSSERSKDE